MSDEGQARRASPKVLAIAGGAIVAVIVAIVLVVQLTGGDDSKPTTTAVAPTIPTGTSSEPATPETELADVAKVNALLKGIPQTATSLGKATAPVTMVEYLDLQCPYCQSFETEVLPTLLRRYVRTGKLRVEPRLVAFIGPDSVTGRLAAVAAGNQKKMSNFIGLLYANQGEENTGWLNDEMIASVAAAIPGLDAAKLEADRTTADTAAKAVAMDNKAADDDVQGTPTILVGKTGGTLTPVAITTSTDIDSVTAAIDAALGPDS